jgi:alkanesulfonate monooxygenase SsuD/methylene tetrahydromethanopterin reductase-like flavin-dependent oxidoreductase (luciferase family)
MSMLRRPVEFGSFITPSAASPASVVELAVLADKSGLDLVSFQDHPYQPAFLDSWTLLSYVAARTTNLMLSSNVSNLPLRPPAMIARAGASLDLFA